MTTIPQNLSDYPFVYHLDVRFRDLDMLAHVNNAVYATYFESARLAFYQQLTGLPLEKLDIILAEMTIRFHAPAVFGDTLAIGVQVASIGRKSFVMEYAAFRGGDDTLIASGKSVLVTYDYQQGQSVPVPEKMHEQVVALQGPFAQ